MSKLIYQISLETDQIKLVGHTRWFIRMWGGIVVEVSFLSNFHIGFNNTQSDILIHLTQWQYWWWFWFSYFWVLYFLLFMRIFRYRVIKFKPRLATTYRPHGKWGDLIVCLLPVSWCVNIITNSNFILRMIEWQAESSLFTLRVRGKQWYWVYKYELKAVTDVLTAPKNIGNNKWVISNPLDLQVADDYLHIHQLRAQSAWVSAYWTGYKDTDLDKLATASENSSFVMGYDFYKNYVKAGWEKNFVRIYNPTLVDFGLDDIFGRLKKRLPAPQHQQFVSNYLLNEDLEMEVEYSPKRIAEHDRKKALLFRDRLTEEQAAKLLPEYMRNNRLPPLLDYPALEGRLKKLFAGNTEDSIYIESEGPEYEPKKKPEKKIAEHSRKTVYLFDDGLTEEQAAKMVPKFMRNNQLKLLDDESLKALKNVFGGKTAESIYRDYLENEILRDRLETQIKRENASIFGGALDDEFLDLFNILYLPRDGAMDEEFWDTFNKLYPSKYKSDPFSFKSRGYQDIFDFEAAGVKIDYDELDNEFIYNSDPKSYTAGLDYILSFFDKPVEGTNGVVFGHSESHETAYYAQKGQSIQTPLRIIKYPLSYIKENQQDDLIELFRIRFGSGSHNSEQKTNTHQTYWIFRQKRYKRVGFVKNRIRYYLDWQGRPTERVYLSYQPYVTKNRLVLADRKSHMTHYEILKTTRRRHENIALPFNKRLLRTRRIVVLPSHVNIAVITNSFDVVHSWFIPGLGIKMDCIPGRSTHHVLHIDNVGFYYGQCAEICGRYHHHMPIRICALPFEHFMVWWHAFAMPRLLKIYDESTMAKKNDRYFYSARKYVW